jgi:hypothetical protein
MTSLQKLTALALFSVATIPWLSTQPAAAVSINVDGQAYETFAVSGKPAESLSDFAAFPSGKMPWWGDPMKASKFAKEHFASLNGSTSDYGPLFAYEFSGTNLNGVVQSFNDPNSQDMMSSATTDSTVYSIAADPSVFNNTQVPTPIPVFGATAAFAWSRQLRRRLHAQQNGGWRQG